MGDIEERLSPLDNAGTQSAQRSHSLRSWSLAAFHTVSFVALAVVATHLNGSLKDALGRLDTGTGMAAFLAFWTLTFFSTRAGLRKMMPIETAPTSSIVFQTTIAGGWNGAGIFASLVVVSLVSGFVSRGLAAMSFLPVQFLVAVIGTLLAFTIGSVVGLVYGLIDALLLGCGEMLHRWARTCP
jgi:hypothetical protein